MMKVARAAIRVKHSIQADAEVNERLPELEHQIDQALLAGRPLALTFAEAWGKQEG